MRMTTAKDLPKACFLCGRNGIGDPLDAHHIFGGANRKLSEQYGLVIPLCHERCHETGKDAVHRSAATAQAVHEFGQRLCMDRMGWSIEEFRAVFGRNYLPEDTGNGGPSGGPVSFQRGKKPGKESRQRGPIPRRSPLETLSDGQGRNRAAVSPIGSSFRETGDGGLETKDEGQSAFSVITEEEELPEWLC